MFRLLAIALVVGLLPDALLGGGKKAPDLAVTFHLQADPGDSHTFKQLTAGREVSFRNTPEISIKDMRAYRPFPADDGQTYGVVFQLNQIAAGRLRNLSTANQDRLLLAVVNGQVRDAVLIDQTVSDGIIVIWKWITLPEVRLADQHLPRIGEDPKDWKARLKKEKREKKRQ